MRLPSCALSIALVACADPPPDAAIATALQGLPRTVDPMPRPGAFWMTLTSTVDDIQGLSTSGWYDDLSVELSTSDTAPLRLHHTPEGSWLEAFSRHQLWLPDPQIESLTDVESGPGLTAEVVGKAYIAATDSLAFEGIDQPAERLMVLDMFGDIDFAIELHAADVRRDETTVSLELLPLPEPW